MARGIVQSLVHFTLISVALVSFPQSSFTQIDSNGLPAVLDTAVVPAPPPAAPSSLIAEDVDYDNGTAIRLSWLPSPDDLPLNSRVDGYALYRAAEGSEQLLTKLPAGATSFVDESAVRGDAYQYRIAALYPGGEVTSILTQPIMAEREWLNFGRTWLFIMALIVGGSVVYFIESARKGKKLFVRKIAGLEAVDEAVGRATEMGRPILFIPGIQDMNDVETIAGLTILGRVARVVADYDTRISVPTSRSLVMTAARETIKAAYQTAGRPDAYNDDMSVYVTDEQFGYVAAIDGKMLREKPATCFYMGAFFAESLILAETGHSVGAIQIAGTARPAQIPFFVAACDFTLIGEELFAASAYLSGEPRQLGSLKGQDVGKGIALVAITAGTILVTIQAMSDSDLVNSMVGALRHVFGAE